MATVTRSGVAPASAPAKVYMGQVIPLDSIGTDRSRLDSYTPFLLRAQQDYTAQVPWTFSHFS